MDAVKKYGIAKVEAVLSRYWNRKTTLHVPTHSPVLFGEVILIAWRKNNNKNG